MLLAFPALHQQKEQLTLMLYFAFFQVQKPCDTAKWYLSKSHNPLFCTPVFCTPYCFFSLVILISPFLRPPPSVSFVFPV